MFIPFPLTIRSEAGCGGVFIRYYLFIIVRSRPNSGKLGKGIMELINTVNNQINHCCAKKIGKQKYWHAMKPGSTIEAWLEEPRQRGDPKGRAH